MYNNFLSSFCKKKVYRHFDLQENAPKIDLQENEPNGLNSCCFIEMQFCSLLKKLKQFKKGLGEFQKSFLNLTKSLVKSQKV